MTVENTIFASATAAFISDPIEIDDVASVTFSQKGLTGGDEITIEQQLGGEWDTLTDKNGDDVKLTATIKNVRVIAPLIVRINKPVTAAETAVFVTR